MAATLRKTAQPSLHAFAVVTNEQYNWEALDGLLPAMTTGAVPFDAVHACSLFEYLGRHPDDLAVFGEAMTNLSSTEIPAVAAACPLRHVGTLVDVGGGQGSLLAALAQGQTHTCTARCSTYRPSSSGPGATST